MQQLFQRFFIELDSVSVLKGTYSTYEPRLRLDTLTFDLWPINIVIQACWIFEWTLHCFTSLFAGAVRCCVSRHPLASLHSKCSYIRIISDKIQPCILWRPSAILPQILFCRFQPMFTPVLYHLQHKRTAEVTYHNCFALIVFVRNPKNPHFDETLRLVAVKRSCSCQPLLVNPTE